MFSDLSAGQVFWTLCRSLGKAGFAAVWVDSLAVTMRKFHNAGKLALLLALGFSAIE